MSKIYFLRVFSLYIRIRIVVFFLSDDALSVGGRVFLFDHVFKENVTQEQVYNNAALPIVRVS